MYTHTHTHNTHTHTHTHTHTLFVLLVHSIIPYKLYLRHHIKYFRWYRWLYSEVENLVLRLGGVSLEGCLLIGDKKTAFPTSNTATFTSVNSFMWRLK